MLPIEHTYFRTTVKFNVKAPGLYNFLCGLINRAGGNQKNNFLSFIVPIQVATVLKNAPIHKTGLYPGRRAYIQNNIFVSKWMGINRGGGGGGFNMGFYGNFASLLTSVNTPSFKHE